MTKYGDKFSVESFADTLWQQRTPPEFLWHYTDGAGLLGVASSNSLWCTEYRYLNDRDELKAFASDFLENLRTKLREKFSENDTDRIVEISELYATWHVFICSFCADSDRNEHWSQYARRSGYAIGFDPSTLRALALAQGFVLAPVIYDPDVMKKIAESVLQNKLSVLQPFTSPLNTADLRKITNFVCRLVLSFAPFFKRHSFQRENEWRLIKIAELGGTMGFRPSRTFGLIAYNEFKFKISTNGKPRLTGSPPKKLVSRVIVGPGNETEGILAAHNVYELFRVGGLEPLVSGSKSSLRFLE